MTEMIPSSQNNPLPFAGRQAIYARLQQQILDPTHRHALVFTGHDTMGKTALLRHFLVVFDEPFLPIFTSLSETIFTDEMALIQSLIDGINHLLNERNFSLSRVPNIEPEGDITLMDWFRDIYLPEVLHIIRPHRRIVWLLDDAEHLLAFPTDFLEYLHSLLEDQTQFSLILSLNTDHDDKLAQLQPLVNPVLAERMHRLNQDESADLMRQYAPGASDAITSAIYQATGGHPTLLTRFGQTLNAYWAEYSDQDAFERAKPDVYAASLEDFRKIWLKLSRDERLVLTAIASLIYHDPLQIVTAKHLEAWLIETDYVLDIVTINAALRGLDYQDIVSHQQGEGINITMGLMQQWLLEQARLEETKDEQRGQLPIRLIAIIVIVIILIILFLMLIPPQYLDSSSPIPTATLAS